jgi:hypothetical protein
MALEPGLDFHEWESRWQQLRDSAEDSPYEALPELVRLVEQMLLERGVNVSHPVAAQADDPEVVRDFLAARDVATAAEAGTADPGDVAAALENLAEIHDYLVEERAAP